MDSLEKEEEKKEEEGEGGEEYKFIDALVKI